MLRACQANTCGRGRFPFRCRRSSGSLLRLVPSETRAALRASCVSLWRQRSARSERSLACEKEGKAMASAADQTFIMAVLAAESTG
jgi:hypothetical protein